MPRNKKLNIKEANEGWRDRKARVPRQPGLSGPPALAEVAAWSQLCRAGVKALGCTTHGPLIPAGPVLVA